VLLFNPVDPHPAANHLKRLAAFEDGEAEERAFPGGGGAPDPLLALQFPGELARPTPRPPV